MKAEEEEFKRLKLIHGAHAPLRMKMERLHLAQIPGHNGLNTSAFAHQMHEFNFAGSKRALQVLGRRNQKQIQFFFSFFLIWSHSLLHQCNISVF